MKTLISLLFVIGSFTFSCNANNVQSSKADSLKCVTGEAGWLSQIDFAKKLGRIAINSRSGLKSLSLVGYSYKGKIETEEQRTNLLKQLFADDTKVVMHFTDKDYEIVPLKEYKETMQSMGWKNPTSYIETQLEDIVKEGMDIIDLEWCYDGELFHSTAIAFKGQIIYDYIGNMAVVPDKKPKSEDTVIKSLKDKRKKNDSDSEQRFYMADHGNINFFGKYVWEYAISCTSCFDENGILYSRNMSATHDSVIGWSCDANIGTVGGEIGKDSFHEFAWGDVHGCGISVSCSWNGSGFSTLGGGTAGIRYLCASC